MITIFVPCTQKKTLYQKRKAAIDLHAEQLRAGLHVPREYHPQTLISCKLTVLSAGRKAGCILSWWVASGVRQDEFGRWALISSSKVRFVATSKVRTQKYFSLGSLWEIMQKSAKYVKRVNKVWFNERWWSSFKN